ncbi:response regulator [Aureimonas leprariae]|uniref:Response regulator n=1 Tax=Plantimonas leprariae TaxID=2615207 RepID=A0A7V7TUL4_9HYPH|nr:response regulator [Aureimonas leprariae]KAB0676282.1 response regulator [Aureimonas leprariae]
MASQSRPSLPIVLVVEDDPILMMAMVDFVEKAGCEAIEATNVVEAIKILETRTDVRTVFTDLDMRGSTAGMKLAVAVRDRWPPVELVLVSSRPWAEHDLPARGVLFGKPFDERRIVSTIRKFAG